MERQIGKGKRDMKGRLEEKVKRSLWRESKCPAKGREWDRKGRKDGCQGRGKGM